jgi:hypothetical protein
MNFEMEKGFEELAKTLKSREFFYKLLNVSIHIKRSSIPHSFFSTFKWV